MKQHRLHRYRASKRSSQCWENLGNIASLSSNPLTTGSVVTLNGLYLNKLINRADQWLTRSWNDALLWQMRQSLLALYIYSIFIYIYSRFDTETAFLQTSSQIYPLGWSEWINSLKLVSNWHLYYHCNNCNRGQKNVDRNAIRHIMGYFEEFHAMKCLPLRNSMPWNVYPWGIPRHKMSTLRNSKMFIQFWS